MRTFETIAVFKDRHDRIVGHCVDTETGVRYYLPHLCAVRLRLALDQIGVRFEGYASEADDLESGKWGAIYWVALTMPEPPVCEDKDFVPRAEYERQVNRLIAYRELAGELRHKAIVATSQLDEIIASLHAVMVQVRQTRAGVSGLADRTKDRPTSD